MADGVVTVLGAVKRPERKAGTPAQEALALKEALVQALAEIETLARRATSDASDMLGFQAAMLSDDELARPAFESVSAGESASAAWETTMAVEISGYRAAEDAHSPLAQPISRTSATAYSGIWSLRRTARRFPVALWWSRPICLSRAFSASTGRRAAPLC